VDLGSPMTLVEFPSSTLTSFHFSYWDCYNFLSSCPSSPFSTCSKNIVISYCNDTSWIFRNESLFCFCCRRPPCSACTCICFCLPSFCLHIVAINCTWQLHQLWVNDRVFHNGYVNSHSSVWYSLQQMVPWIWSFTTPMLNPFSVYNPFMNIYIYGNMLVKLLQTQKYYDPEMSSSNLYMFVC